MLDSQRYTLYAKDVELHTSKILLIVRFSKLVNLLKLELSHQGHKIAIADDGMSGLLKCRENKPQLIILDWNISIFSAADLCGRLKSKHNSILVFDTNKQNDEIDRTRNRIAALDAGADDCISFPFAISEFFARIRVQLRKYQVEKKTLLEFEDLRLDSSTREVYRGDRYIYLTNKEFLLLEYLLTYPRQVLTRNQILERIWGFNYLGDSNIIEVYVRYLRLKLEEDNGKRLIYTVRSVGYVLRESSFY